MSKLLTLDEWWQSIASSNMHEPFRPELLRNLPVGAVSYLTHAIAVGTPLALSVRLKMHGEIKIGGWHPFTAEQAIQCDGSMIWEARTSMLGLKVSGSDRLLQGQGHMQWKLFGLLPLVNAGGPDITKSATGRVDIESLWLPSRLCKHDVRWTSSDTDLIQGTFDRAGEPAPINFQLGPNGRLQRIWTQRWGNPDKLGYRFLPFGAIAEQERTFGGFTIASRLRAGWFFGTDRYESDGEFLRVIVDDAIFR